MIHGDLHGRGGGRAAAEATASFNALLRLHGDDAGRHFLLDQQPDVVDGAAPLAPEAAASRSASLCAENQYSGYGDVPAAPMTTTKPFSQQHFVSGFFASSTRNFSDVASEPRPMTTKPLLLQALEQKAFRVRHGLAAEPAPPILLHTYRIAAT